ncbi:MAG: hypothetical protein AB1468_00440 [Candidatus Micrarchaeota archaeon]
MEQVRIRGIELAERAREMFVFASVFFSLVAFASGADCGVYHNLFSVSFNNLYVEKFVYSPGETVRGAFDAQSRISHPLVDGRVRVQALYQPDYIRPLHGPDIVDEFFLEKEVNMRANDSEHFEFEWKLPARARPGVYKLALFFYMGPFQVGGASFIPNMQGGLTMFEVRDTGEGWEQVRFERGKIDVSGRQYSPSNTLNIERRTEEEIVVSVPVVNEGGPGEVNVTYETIMFEDVKQQEIGRLVGEGKIPSDSIVYKTYRQVVVLAKTQRLVMGENETRVLKYSVGKLPPGAYTVRITARSKDMSAVLHIRVPVRGLKADFAFGSPDVFPIKKGDDVVLAACFSTTTSGPGMTFSVDGSAPGVSGEGKYGRVSLSFASGNETLAWRDYVVVLSPAQQAVELPFKSTGKIRDATLTMKLFDENGNMLDVSEMRFDYSKFKSNRTLALRAVGGESIVFYTVDVADDLGDPAEGTVNVYLLSNDTKVVALHENRDVFGELNGTLEAGEGEYRVKAFDADSGASDTAYVRVRARAPKPPEPQPPAAPTERKGETSLLLLASIIIGLALIIYWSKRTLEITRRGGR